MKKTYSERAHLSLNPVAKRLFLLMDEKKSNLCLSADVTSAQKLLQLADQIGPEIVLLKTHIDIINDFTPTLTEHLLALCEKHNFLIFEDRKFADIGNTVKLQYQEGIYRICDWAHIVNAHSLTGPGVIEGLKSVGVLKSRAILLLAELSSKDNFITPSYTQKTVKLAHEHEDFVIGFICQKKLSDNPAFIYMTPGVNLAKGGDKLGQQYNSPQEVILEQESDIIIVGRAILDAPNPLEEAKKYRQHGWHAYENRLGIS